jgi:hypothetical protein
MSDLIYNTNVMLLGRVQFRGKMVEPDLFEIWMDGPELSFPHRLCEKGECFGKPLIATPSTFRSLITKWTADWRRIARKMREEHNAET